MSLLIQINFWSKEAKRTSNEANDAFKAKDFKKAQHLLFQTKTTLARLRKEVEATGLLAEPTIGEGLEKDLQTAENELRGLMETVNEALND